MVLGEGGMAVYQASARVSDLSDFPQAYIDVVERGYFLRPSRRICGEYVEGMVSNASCMFGPAVSSF